MDNDFEGGWCCLYVAIIAKWGKKWNCIVLVWEHNVSGGMGFC